MYHKKMNGPVIPMNQTADEKQFIGYDQMSIMYYCFEQDIKLYSELLDAERIYCSKVKHAYDLSNFILTVKPFVCLNFDANGFNLVRQDRCDKHQANPLLTGQLLFGIV